MSDEVTNDDVSCDEAWKRLKIPRQEAKNNNVFKSLRTVMISEEH